MVLFGSSAPLIVDVNLVLQYISLVLLIVGYVKKKPFKTHGNLMVLLLLITVSTTVTIMAPRLFITLSSYGQMIFAHVILGILAMCLGIIFTFRYIRALQNNTPMICGSKNMMRLALLLWIIPILGGTMAYVTLYL